MNIHDGKVTDDSLSLKMSTFCLWSVLASLPALLNKALPFLPEFCLGLIECELFQALGEA
jgi:hypothetical protein